MDNLYEYPGIRKLWNIGQSNDDKTIILYFHSKGMTSGNLNETQDRWGRELSITVIDAWRDVLNEFQKYPHLNKAGYACSRAQWVWYNFMWVRASYLHTIVNPVISQRRHYYEDWIARKTPWPKIDNIVFMNFDHQ
eukprot:gene3967-5687_t